MFKFFQFLIKAITLWIRTKGWIDRQKSRISGWFSCKPTKTQKIRTTIISPDTVRKRKKIFGRNEGSYVEFEEERSGKNHERKKSGRKKP